MKLRYRPRRAIRTHYTYTVRKAIKTSIFNIRPNKRFKLTIHTQSVRLLRRILVNVSTILFPTHYTYTVRKAIKTMFLKYKYHQLVGTHYTYTVRKAIKTYSNDSRDLSSCFSLYIHSP